MKFRAYLVPAFAMFLGSAVIAQQPAPPGTVAAKPPTRPRPAGGAPTYQAVATVQDLMAGLIDPASKVVFNAVSSETTASGTVEKAPANDGEWAAVRTSALMMAEGANLLMVPGRHITRNSANRKSGGESAAEGSLPPSEIEVRVARDRGAWNRFAVRLREAALESLRAAEAKTTDAFGPASESLDNACENCHLKFWYPNQEKLLRDAPQPK